MKDERTYGGEQTIWKHGVKYYIVCIPIIIGELISIIPISIDKYTERKYNATVLDDDKDKVYTRDLFARD